MTQFMDTYNGFRFYFFDHSKLSLDDFFRLEQVVALENELTHHQIFFVSNIDGFKIYTSLN